MQIGSRDMLHVRNALLLERKLPAERAADHNSQGRHVGSFRANKK